MGKANKILFQCRVRPSRSELGLKILHFFFSFYGRTCSIWKILG